MNISSSFHSDDIEHDLMEMIRYHLARSNKNIVNCHFYPTPFLYIDKLYKYFDAIMIVVIFKHLLIDLDDLRDCNSQFYIIL